MVASIVDSGGLLVGRCPARSKTAENAQDVGPNEATMPRGSLKISEFDGLIFEPILRCGRRPCLEEQTSCWVQISRAHKEVDEELAALHDEYYRERIGGGGRINRVSRSTGTTVQRSNHLRGCPTRPGRHGSQLSTQPTKKQMTNRGGCWRHIIGCITYRRWPHIIRESMVILSRDAAGQACN